MRFLLTNDDGIQAPGLAAMAQALAAVGQVCVAAPDHNCSANSHHLTMQSPVTAQRVTYPGADEAWAIDGTPADCVHLAVSMLLQQPVDLVVSGINRGANFSTDCLYSGTVAAALEGRLLGLPGLAMSLDSFAPDADYTAAARVGVSLAKALLQDGACMTWNVNVPAVMPQRLKGIRWARIDRIQRYPQKVYTCLSQEENGKTICQFVPADFDRQQPSADVQAVAEGYVSVTPLTCFWNDEQQLSRLAASRLELE